MILPNFQSGQWLQARDLQALVAAAREIRAGQLRPAPGMMLAEHPDGTTATVKARSVVSVDYPFRFTIGEDGEDLVLRFTTPGTAAGLEPTIAGQPAFAPAADGQWPGLKIKRASFDPKLKRCFVYLRYTLDSTEDVTAVAVEAYGSKPAGSPTVFFKLLAWLQNDSAGALHVYPQIFWAQNLGVVPGGGKFPYAA